MHAPSFRLTRIVLVASIFLMPLSSIAASPNHFKPPVSSPDSWYDKGKDIAEKASILPINNHRAKNVLFFVGDGMGISTITASRILAGQQPNIIGTGNDRVPSSGEENLLSFESLPWRALSKVYSVDQQTPDSAPTMTAMVTGIKTIGDQIAVDQNIPHGATSEDCKVDLTGHKLKTILEIAEEKGKSTGLVSTARITHATPAANYAHTTNRDWESDSNQPTSDCVIPDIATQLIEFNYGNGIDVLFGGGRSYFRPNTSVDPEYDSKKGNRKDGKDLITEWLNKYKDGHYVYDQKGFSALDNHKAQHVLGLFEPSHMQYEVDRDRSEKGDPSLADMTEKAIRILNQNKKGFYLHVESGRIDHGHHAGNAYRALTETISLSDAVTKAINTLKELGVLEDTLIIVTADHSHVFTIAGYPERGNNILGKVISFDHPMEGYALADDNMPYTTLSYANGPGFHEHAPADDASYPANSGRQNNLKDVDTTDKDFHQQSLVPFTPGNETHAGEDVAIFAMGPKAHLFHGTLENNAIFHVIFKAFDFKP